MVDIVGVVERVRDVEPNPNDTNPDNGTSLINRFTNDVYGVRFGIHPSSKVDIRGNYYYSQADSNPTLTPTSFGTSGFSPTAAGKIKDPAYKADARPQRSVRHRSVVQPRVLQHRRPVRIDHGPPAASPTCC